jgi:hypothetical protein
MMFRLLIIGGSGFYEYPRLRDALDFALANRLPHVEILSIGGPGVPALAASYARSRGLLFRPILPDFEKHPGNAIEKRNSLLISEADAVIVAAGEIDLPTVEWLKAVKRKGIPTLTVGSNWHMPIKSAAVPRPRGLPD